MLPALVIGYNRPEHTITVLDSLRRAGIRELFVALDGPQPGDEPRSSQVRAVVESLNWPDHLEVRLADINQGPGWGPRNAIDWFFSHVPVGIICEDDTVLAVDAATFLTAAAADFRDHVPMAAATSLGWKKRRGEGSYFASRYATTWGWATTAQAWSMYDYAMSDWPERRMSDWLLQIGGSKDFAKHWLNVFDMTYSDRDHFWDYQWQYAMWKNDWRCWHPRVNLVTNIGFDAFATHTRFESAGLAHLDMGKLPVPLVAPASDQSDSRVDRWIDRKVYRTQRSLRGRAYRRLFRPDE